MKGEGRVPGFQSRLLRVQAAEHHCPATSVNGGGASTRQYRNRPMMPVSRSMRPMLSYAAGKHCSQELLLQRCINMGFAMDNGGVLYEHSIRRSSYPTVGPPPPCYVVSNQTPLQTACIPENSGVPLYPDEITMARDPVLLRDALNSEESESTTEGSNDDEGSRCEIKKGSPVCSFPSKLHKILSNPLYKQCIAWLPHGRAWKIVKPQVFTAQVLPKYFRSDRYASFMRQVNGWGFRRITEGIDQNAYYHEMFLRGMPDLCAEIRRPQKGQMDQSYTNLGECPDFYRISALAPLPDDETPGDPLSTNHIRTGKRSPLQQNPPSPTSPLDDSGIAEWDWSQFLASTPLKEPEKCSDYPYEMLDYFDGGSGSPINDVTSTSGSYDSFDLYDENQKSLWNPCSHDYESLCPLHGVDDFSPTPIAPCLDRRTNGQIEFPLSTADLCYLAMQNRLMQDQMTWNLASSCNM